MPGVITPGIDARWLPLADESVDCIVTSPPYYSLRQYGDDRRELGRGTLEDYLIEFSAWTDEAYRVLKADGTFWLNIGDTAANSGGAGGDYNAGGRKAGQPRYRQGKSSIRGNQWCLVPQRAAILLQERGWLIRQVITWDKGVIRPESLAHVRRPGVSSEVIIMAVKTKDYRFYPEMLEESGDVWHFPPSRGRGHLAPYPPELPRRCILASTRMHDTVLDPFAGSGTTLQVAFELNRTPIGFDLYDFAPGLSGEE